MNSTNVIGAWPPPPGVIPNFQSPDYIGYRVVVAALVSLAFAIPFVLMRLYTKRYIFDRFDLDDYSIVVALLCAAVYSVLQVVQTKNGSGVHIWDVPADKFSQYIKLGIGGAVTYNLSTLFTKASILLLYLRLTREPIVRSAVYVIMFVAVGYSLCGAFAFLYLCHPIQRYWDFSVPGTCVNIGNAFLAGAALNVATDIALLLLPIWLLHPLRLPMWQKIGVTLILMTGSFVCAVSIFRLVIIPAGLTDPDSTWHYVRNLIWCIIEMYTGIICACLPSLKPFVKQHFPNLFARPEAALVRPSNYIPFSTHETNGPQPNPNGERCQLTKSKKSDVSAVITEQGLQSTASEETYVQH